MKRRDVLSAGLALAATSVLAASQAKTADRWVKPGAPGWPSDADWAGLKQAVEGRLAPVKLPDLADPEVRKLIGDPFYLADQPGLTESSGWVDAWRAEPSAYVVAAKSSRDVAASIAFARTHKVRLVIRGGGHSYLGTSSAPNSLMIWTRRMNAITVHDAFTPAGSKAAPVPAVSAGAGSIWLHLYQAVSPRGRYVQGGGCTTVGITGLLLGGGFGNFSKRYGLAAASLIEAEIVTADGRTRVVNATQEPDLFWALKGGGGGTFGVVTRLTLATHDLPETFGSFSLDVLASSDEAYHRLLARFVDLYATRLFNPHWGETVVARPDNRLTIRMVFQGLTKEAPTAAWQPLLDFIATNAADYPGYLLNIGASPARLYWDAGFRRRYGRQAVVFDHQPGASADDFSWSDNTDEAGAFWYAYNSTWLPASLLKPQNQARFVDAWFAASRHWPVIVAFNKGLAGAPAEAIEAARNTATNPDVVDAFAWAVIGAHGPPAFAGLPPPDLTTAAAQRSRVRDAMKALSAVAPNTGTYLNECDYFQPDWQRAFWGANYPRLLAIKRHYDPEGLFTVHHGVGSEA
jgi:hypothetical protein